MSAIRRQRSGEHFDADINQNVILAQNALVQAESNVAVNQIGLRRNLLTVLTKTGELLAERGIVIQ